MTQNGGVWIFNSFDQASSCLFLIHFQVGVDRSHDKIKALQYLIRIIQRTNIQEIRLDPFENMKSGNLFIQMVDLFMLLQHPLYA